MWSGYRGATKRMADNDEVPDSEFAPHPSQFTQANHFPTDLLLPDGRVQFSDAVRGLTGKVLGKPPAEVKPWEILEITDPVRKDLVNGDIKLECLGLDGTRQFVEPTVFKEWAVWSAACWDPTTVSQWSRGGIPPGYVIVEEDALNRFLPDADSRHGAEGSRPPYVPPLLAYALELAERFDLSPNYKFDKKAMQRAIRQLLGEEPALPVATKVPQIATFLGSPAYERGGGGRGRVAEVNEVVASYDRAGINVDRPLDPAASHNGVEYPRPRRRRRGELGGLL